MGEVIFLFVFSQYSVSYRKSIIKLPGGLIYFKQGGLIETGDLFEWGARGEVFNLAKTMVSVLREKIECNFGKAQGQRLEVMQVRIKNKSVIPAAC